MAIVERPATADHATKPNAHLPAPFTIGGYLVNRLYEMGVRHVFGIPGDYVLGLYSMMESSPIHLIGTTREDNAGYAADAYARVHGIGCICVTYCVGGLSVCNSLAGAYAEKSPVVMVTGSPGLSERAHNPLLHHKVRDFSTQYEVFEKITVAAAVLDDPLTAFHEIDRVLDAAVRYKRPVYLEIPRDMVLVEGLGPHRRKPQPTGSDPEALREALEETRVLLTKAKRPMILADVEIHRFGLQDLLLGLAESAQLPIATTILGKSVIPEEHPLFVGVYEGAMGRAEVTEYVEQSDCLLMLGCFLSDINLGIFTAQLDPSRCINATSEDLQIRHHHYQEVPLDEFIAGLRTLDLNLAPMRPIPERIDLLSQSWSAETGAKLTSARLFNRLNHLVRDHKLMVITDVGDCLFGAADLSISQQTEFLSPAYYTSMGFSIPAALGTGMASPGARPLVLVGDGAFQMTGMELATIVRQKLNPIVVILNNDGYTTERFLLEGPFNDILNWNYHKIPDVLGSGIGLEVHTEDELDDALERALANTESFSLINVHLDRLDKSPALERLANRLSKKI